MSLVESHCSRTTHQKGTEYGMATVGTLAQAAKFLWLREKCWTQGPRLGRKEGSQGAERETTGLVRLK